MLQKVVYNVWLFFFKGVLEVIEKDGGSKYTKMAIRVDTYLNSTFLLLLQFYPFLYNAPIKSF